jgi:asparagine synthase (glutamine-hydrolysing)
MCGIAGVIDPDGSPVERAWLGEMVGQLRHRGPDGSGVFHDAGVGLCHTRLSILDLAGGHQPMSNQDRSLWITFNGEIFNHLELREELEQKGHRFATRSDTEVLLHLYQEEGVDCVTHLNGQWAFAIWDRRQQHTFLSRDRFGVRPLFYSLADRKLVFASEIKALFAHPGVPREIDEAALQQIFTFWHTLPPQTIFKGVAELPPGHSLIFKDGELRVWQYWSLDSVANTPERSREDERTLAEELLRLLLDASRLRLRADVPVGSYLSGGLDSTVVTALMRKLRADRIGSFAVSFDDAEFDESQYQREASDFLGTEHQDAPCSHRDIAEVFPDVIWHTETPILRTAPAPMFLLSRLVRNKGFKVVLSGEGSDEFMGGYDIYKESKVRRFLAAQPDSRLRPLLLRRLYPYLPGIQRQPEAYLQSFFHTQPGETRDPFFSHLRRWELTARLQTFFSDDMRHRITGLDPIKDLGERTPPSYASWSDFRRAEYLESNYLLPGYILSSQGDRMAMAHAVEGRYPFLDHRVVEFASRVPAHLKLKVLNEKYLLKRAVQGMIPERIRRRSKQPYRAPDGRSFFGGRPLEYVEELLSSRALQRDGIFDPAAVEHLVRKFKTGRALGVKDDMALVGILSTQLVVDRFVNHFQRSGTVESLSVPNLPVKEAVP